MVDRFQKELGGALDQLRGLLEDLQRLGIEQISTAPDPFMQPLCSREPESIGGPCRIETLEEIRADLGDCRRCGLSEARTRIVFGEGHQASSLVLVGEAPGREEDRQGMPFVGEAGRLLERILFAMGLSREGVYICNVQKCRPPRNRDPLPEEIAACEPFLRRQLRALRPRVIVSLGRFSAQTLLATSEPIGALRGRWQSYAGIDLMPTYHPAYLLRNPAAKREVWEDMKQVMVRLRHEDA